jgi:RNA polymerase sigma-70 factor, ECF subfamily
MTAQRADELVFSDAPLVGSPEERAMALAFKRGERDAYEAIHERYEARVRSVCRRMLSDPDDAQEAAQEAFLRVYQGLPRFNGRFRLGAWIVRITTNVCLDQLRARSRRPADPVPRELLDLESPLAEDTDPQILFLRHAEGRRVRKVLDSLPPLHRAAIVLRDFEGIAYADIAETLGITEGQVKALLHRARKGFKRSWAANVASMLLPAGMFKRFFKPWELPSHASGQVGAVSQAAESALSMSGQFAASATQAVNACGGAMHQCSQFMADKAAPVVAAVVVGTASVGAAVVSKEAIERDAPAKKGASAIAAAPDNDGDDSGTTANAELELSEPKVIASISDKQLGAETKEEKPEDSTQPPAEQEEPQPPPEEPPAAEAPAETPPPPAPDATPTPSPSPPAEPVPPAAPEWNLVSSTTFSSQDLCACDATPKLEVSKLSGTPLDRMEFFQRATGAITDLEGDPAWATTVQYSGKIDGGGAALDVLITLHTAQGKYQYKSWTGSTTDRGQLEDGAYYYDFHGRYKPVGQSGRTDLMPRGGELATTLLFTSDGTLYNAVFQLIEDAPTL